MNEIWQFIPLKKGLRKRVIFLYYSREKIAVFFVDFLGTVHTVTIEWVNMKKLFRMLMSLSHLHLIGPKDTLEEAEPWRD